MKILFLARSLNTGGAERQLVTLAVQLKKRDHDVSVVTFYDDQSLFGQELLKHNVTVHSLQKQNRWDVVGFLIRLIALINREKPEVLHGYLVVPNCLTVFLKPFFPAVKIVWGVRSSLTDLSQYDWLIRVTYKLEALLSRFADLIIVNSHAGVKSSLDSGFPEKNMVVVANGIDIERFYPDTDTRLSARESQKISNDIFVVGIVARIDPVKDYANFILGLKTAMAQYENIRGICVGAVDNDDYNSRIQKIIEEHNIGNKVLWLGKQSDVNYFLNAFDLYVSSSTSGEGFSNSIAEAMASGTPCVVTDVGDSAMIVGKTGGVVPPKDAQLLADSIVHMYECIQRKDLELSKQARERIVCHYTIDKMVNRTERLLLRLIE